MHVNRLGFSNSEGFEGLYGTGEFVLYRTVSYWFGLDCVVLYCIVSIIISYWFSYVWFRVVCFVLYFIMYWFAGIIIHKLIILSVL